MKINHQKIYESSTDFFELNGNCRMKVSPLAGIDICKECVKRGIYVWKIEGGIWHNPGFEARIDCIWDSSYLPENETNISVEQNNTLAEEFIFEEMKIHDVFIITIYQSEKK